MDKCEVIVVGIGPGDKEHMTFEAVNALESADVIIGYTLYAEILRKYFPDKSYITTPMKKETDRCLMAYETAAQGKRTAMVSSGDSGIYGMAGIMTETVEMMNKQRGTDVSVRVVAGVTAASAAAAVLGAPLMHDFAVISLSDLMTPFDLIMKRVRCAAEADMVICIYNPRSKKRRDHICRAVDIMLEYKDPKTPVGIVKNACRDGQKITVTCLGELDAEDIDMFCTVIVGNSQTYVSGGKIITPRGYDMNGSGE